MIAQILIETLLSLAYSICSASNQNWRQEGLGMRLDLRYCNCQPHFASIWTVDFCEFSDIRCWGMRQAVSFYSQRRFPDFSYITESGRSLTEHIDCLIIRWVCHAYSNNGLVDH